MGFYIQDDYYKEAVTRFKKERDQEKFWALMIRYYFTGEDHSDTASEAVSVAFGMAKSRIDKAGKERERKRSKRGQSEDTARTDCGHSANYPSMNLESERERKKEKEKKKEKTAPPASSPCPKCGEARGAIVAGMYRCDECDITWKGAAS